MENNTELNFGKLISIIIQCFGLIFIGYVVNKFGIITPEQSKGLSSFTSKLSLPALVFISIVNLNFSSVNWRFVFLIFFSKLTVFSIVSIVTLLLTRPANIGLAAIYSIFCTQGNDFAFGYPILSMLYVSRQKEFLDYLYILVPIQLLILNPIGTILLETHVLLNSSENKKEKKNMLVQVLKNLISNPINIMTFFGIFWNLIISNQVPVLIDNLLDTIAKSFSATALFLLGFSLKGKFQQFKKSETLILPVVLVVVKTIAYPLLNRLFVENGLSLLPSCLKEYSSFAFFYGTIPTAPTALIFALDYNLKPDIVASALVICIILSSPIMLISIYLVRSACFFMRNYKQDLENFIKITSEISLPCIICVLVIFLARKKYKYITHQCLIIILLAQLINCLSVFLNNFLIFDKERKQFFNNNFQYIISASSLFLVRIWISVLAISVGLLSYNKVDLGKKLKKVIFVFASVLSFFLCCLVILYPNHNSFKFFINYENCSLETKISTFLLFNSLSITTISIIVYQRSLKSFNIHKNSKPNKKPSINDQQSCFEENQTSSSSLNSRNLEAKNSIDLDTVCIYESSLVSSTEMIERDYSFFREHQVFSCVVFLLIASMSMYISFIITMLKIMTGTDNFIYMEIQFLDAVLNYGLGIVLFMLFGLKPLTKYFSKYFFLTKFFKKFFTNNSI